MTKKLCSICFSNDFQLSDIAGYENICVACECTKMNDDLENLWVKELNIFYKRTGKLLDFNDFYYECEKGNVKKNDLKGLPELKICLQDALMNVSFYTNCNLNIQLEIDFNLSNDISF